jgi:ecotin
MKITIKAILLLLIVYTSQLFAQNKPTYPVPKNGFKRVDLLLPKIDDPKNYKVEIQFSFEANLSECSDATFYFNPKEHLSVQYGIPTFSRFPYYVITNEMFETLETRKPNCNGDKKVVRKIFSTIDYFIEYQSYYSRPFYIPETWSIEYRIWKASDKYINLK